MKHLFAIVAIAISFPSLAEENPSLMTVATEKNVGVMAIGDRVAYTKEFDLLILNGGEKQIDLAKGCWRLYGPRGEVYELDTIGEEVTSGTLKPKNPRKSFAIFAGEDPAIHNAKLVRFLLSCPKK